MGGGVDLPRRNKTTGVKELPWGDKTSGVTPGETKCWGRINGGGEGTKTTPPP